MFTRLKALKVEIEHLQLLMDKAKVKLQREFEAWWAAEASSLQVWCGDARAAAEGPSGDRGRRGLQPQPTSSGPRLRLEEAAPQV